MSALPPRGSSAGGLTESAAWRVASRTVLFILAVLFLLWLVVQLRSVVVQVLMAIILAAGMAPLVDRFTTDETAQRWRWRPPRALVVLGLYLVLIGLMVTVGGFVFPPLVQELEDLAGRLPGYVSRIEGWIEGLPSQYPFLPPFDTSGGLRAPLQAAASQVTGVLSQALVVVRLALGLLQRHPYTHPGALHHVR
jgi:predicted PurR-regulated permease PerM